jgi:hypothetical protein
MRRLHKSLAIIGSMVVTACMPTTQYEAWTHQPIPPSWNIATQWKLIILDQKAKLVASVTLQFTEEKADSCAGGDWKRVKVSDFRSIDEHFFPGNENLFYEVSGKAFSIGRNEICDAYLTLVGEITAQSVSGIYRSEGLSYGKDLGRFYAVPLR